MGSGADERIVWRTNFHCTLAHLADKAKLTPRDDMSGIVSRNLGPPLLYLVAQSLEGSCLLTIYEGASFYGTTVPNLKVWSRIDQTKDLFIIEVNPNYEKVFCNDFLPEMAIACTRLKFLAFVPLGESCRVLYCNFEKRAP